jgi:fructose-bisphosphate aldolase class I
MAGHPGEKITEGLDGLRERLAEYRKLGARFAKWRAVITIGKGIPSQSCIDANAHALARYAALCQEVGLVPIVEPEVLMDADNTIECCYEVTYATLRSVFHALYAQRIVLEQLILKTNMVIAGKKCPRQASVSEVAEETVRCLRNTVPAAVAGIVFLSGGQSAQRPRGPCITARSATALRASGATRRRWSGKRLELCERSFVFRSSFPIVASLSRLGRAIFSHKIHGFKPPTCLRIPRYFVTSPDHNAVYLKRLKSI